MNDTQRKVAHGTTAFGFPFFSFVTFCLFALFACFCAAAIAAVVPSGRTWLVCWNAVAKCLEAVQISSRLKASGIKREGNMLDVYTDCRFETRTELYDVA